MTYPEDDNHKMIISGNVKCEPVETEEMARTQKEKEYMLVFRELQYTINEKIEVRVCKSYLVNNRIFF